MNVYEEYEPCQDGAFLNHVYWRLAQAMNYPGVETGRIKADLNEVLEDALHMIELGHRYLDLMER